MFNMRSIGRQLLLVVFTSLVIFSVGVTSLIGYQSFKDMQEIAQSRTKGAAELYAFEFQSLVDQTQRSLNQIQSNPILLQHLQSLLTEQPTPSPGQFIASQLKVASLIDYLLLINQLSNVKIYQNKAKPVPLLSVSHDFIDLYSHTDPSNQMLQRFDRQTLPSALDILSSHTYSQVLEQLNSTLTTRPVDLLTQLKNINTESDGRVIHVLNDKLKVTLWSNITLANNANTTNFIITANITPDHSMLNHASTRMGSDLAIVDEEHVWESSINYQIQPQQDNLLNFFNQTPYLFHETPLNISGHKSNEFKIMALNSTQNLRNKTWQLIVKLSLITVIAITTTGLFLYLIVKKILRRPLAELLKGVNQVKHGDLDIKVNVNVNNELSTLGDSFNSMTERISRQANELKLSNENLELKVKERTEDLQNAQQQLILSEKMATLGQLVAGISHEINTPIGNSITALTFNMEELNKVNKLFTNKEITIAHFSDFIQASNQSMEIINANLKKASELVQTFKSVAVNQSVEELTTFSLKKHLDEVVITLNPLFKKAQVNLHLDIADDLMVTSYPGSYYHIISNMIVNSLTHAFPDNIGDIYISAQFDDENLILIYRDNGKGMTQETTAKIFDPFYTTRRGQGGTGLGMYMTYNIVTQKLNGTIDLKSQQNAGTEFTLTLPANSKQYLSDNDDHFAL